MINFDQEISKSCSVDRSPATFEAASTLRAINLRYVVVLNESRTSLTPMTFTTALFLLYSFQNSNRVTIVPSRPFLSYEFAASENNAPSFVKLLGIPRPPALITTSAFWKFGFLPASGSDCPVGYTDFWHTSISRYFLELQTRPVIFFIKIDPQDTKASAKCTISPRQAQYLREQTKGGGGGQ